MSKKKRKSDSAKCYNRCDEAGTTTEHVPPKGFFPPGFRRNLWTVDSCPTHNTGNAKDVEYVAAIIVSALQSTGTALEENQKKVFRAFDRSKGFFLGTLNNPKPVRLPNGEQTATFSVDLSRFNSVMEAIAYGLYYYLSGKTYDGYWKVVSPSLGSDETIHKGRRDTRTPLLDALTKMSFEEIKTPEPDVFTCGVHTFPDGKVAYKFVFYGGFTVYAIDTFIYEVMTDGRI